MNKMFKVIKHHQSLFVFTFMAVLSIGCFWQIFNVCDLYFKYPTNVFIETNFDPLTKTIPALTFVKHIGNHSGLNSSAALELQSNDIKNNLFKNIFIYNSSGDYDVKNYYLGNAFERISFGYYSIVFNSFLAGNNVTKIRILDRLVFEWNVYGDNHSSWWLFMHNSFDVPASNGWNAVPILVGEKTQVTWKLDSYRLLKRPYPTDCTDYYKTNEYLSRSDCIRKCRLTESLNKCHNIYEGIDIFRGEPSVQFGGSEQKQCIDEIDFEIICRKQCNHFDCSIDYYEPVLITHWMLDENDPTTLHIVFPIKPETVYYHGPKLATIEFVCYLASTMSMWFGLSIYSLNYAFIMCRNRLMQKTSPSKQPRTNHLSSYFQGQGFRNSYKNDPQLWRRFASD